MNTPAAYADTAAEAIRAFNHATLPGRDGLTEPADAYQVLANLSSLADRLRQAITQTQRYLDREEASGGIRIVDGEHRDNPAAAIDACRQLTRAATANATALASALHAAQQTLTWAAVASRDDDYDRDVLAVVRDDYGRAPRSR